MASRSRLVERAAKFAGGAHHQRKGFDDRMLGDEGAGGDDGIVADAGAVENDGANADEAAILDGAAVQGGAMADRDPLAEFDRERSVCPCRTGRPEYCCWRRCGCELTSPRKTAHGQTLTFSASTTSPITWADSST